MSESRVGAGCNEVVTGWIPMGKTFDDSVISVALTRPVSGSWRPPVRVTEIRRRTASSGQEPAADCNRDGFGAIRDAHSRKQPLQAGFNVPLIQARWTWELAYCGAAGQLFEYAALPRCNV